MLVGTTLNVPDLGFIGSIPAPARSRNTRSSCAFLLPARGVSTKPGADPRSRRISNDDRTRAIESVYGQLFAQSPDLHVEIGARIGAGDWVVDEEVASGINFEGMPPAMHALIVYHVSEGRIDRAQMLA